MDSNLQSLPSEKLQKEFEDNPFKILEIIRKEKEIDQTKELEKEINEINSTSFNNEKMNIETLIINNIYDLTGKNNINNKNDVNYLVNNINNNCSINGKMNTIFNKNNNTSYNNTYINYNYNYNYNCNSNIDLEKNNNKITVNHLNIFFNFNDNSNYVNNNINSIYKKEEIDNYSKNKNNITILSSKSNNIDDKNDNSNNDKDKILFLSNPNILLENLKSFKGSIISQKFVNSITEEEECQILFKNLAPYICTIMCLEYGNYFFQKFLEKLKIEQKLSIYQIMENEFYNIASNKFGTHSIQSLINNIRTDIEIAALNRLISKNMYFLFTDNNAYHIMMKLILDFPEEKRNLLNLFLVMNIEKIIINCNGAFCVNKFIINNKDLNLRAMLIKNLRNNIKELIFNKFSCINLLLIIETFGIKWGYFILKEIEENFGVLIEHPVSNVFISKVLLFLNNNYPYELKVLLWSIYKNIVLMKNLISNKNNNKIVNQLIEYSNEEQKKYLFFILNKYNSKGDA